MRSVIALGFLLLATGAVEARTPAPSIECTREGCGPPPVWRQQHQRTHRGDARKPKRTRHATVQGVVGGEVRRVIANVQFLAHYAVCPRVAFCGCATAMRVFGKPIRDLWLASNWLRFPEAEAAPGRVAVRRRGHHVFVIEEVLGHGMVLAFDPNSGGHKTRLWVRSLAGYRVVDPRG